MSSPPIWADTPESLTETVIAQFVLPPTRVLAHPALRFDADDERPTTPAWIDLAPADEGGVDLGPYRVIEVLAVRSGLALVHGQRPALQGPARDVVLKVPTRIEDPSSPVAIDLAIEADRLSATHHPNVVPLVDAGRAGSRPYLAFAGLSGTNLRRVVETLGARSEALPFSVVAWITAEACRGLDALLRFVGPQASPTAVEDGQVLIGLDGEVRLAGYAMQTGARSEERPLAHLASRAQLWLTGGDMGPEWVERYEVPPTLAEILQTAERSAAPPTVIADALDAWRATLGNPMTPALMARFLEGHRLLEAWPRAFGPMPFVEGGEPRVEYEAPRSASASSDSPPPRASSAADDGTPIATRDIAKEEPLAQWPHGIPIPHSDSVERGASGLAFKARPPDATPAGERAPRWTSRPEISSADAQGDSIDTTIPPWSNMLIAVRTLPPDRLRAVGLVLGAAFALFMLIQMLSPDPPPPRPGIKQVLIGGDEP